MQTKHLPGISQPLGTLVLGTQAFGTTITVQDSFRMLDLFFDAGGSIVDTARLYGYYAENAQGISETVLGWWMQARKNRSRVVLGTKGAHPPLGQMQQGRLDAKSLRDDLEESLRALQTDYIDMYWLHRDDVSRPVEEILHTCNAFVREGKVRFFGASNWTTSRLLAAQEHAKTTGIQGFSATQPQWSLARQEVMDDPTLVVMDPEMYQMHCATGLPVMPFSSQAKGFYYKLAQGGEESLSPKAKARFLSPRNMRTYAVLQSLSEKTGFSVGALSIAYLTGQPFPVFPIVGYSTLTQAQALIEAGTAVLSPDDIALLNRTAELA